MATTTNYGWTTPDDTALVKDGAAAIRSLGTSIDTTTKNLNPSTTLGDLEYRSSTSNTNTRIPIGTSGQGLQVVAGVPAWAASSTSTLTTTGDILYASAANTLARRAIGSTGDVLTVSGGVPTWATPASGSITSLASGSLSSTELNLTSISGSYKDLRLILKSVYVSATSNDPYMRLNGVTTASSYVRSGGNTTLSSATDAFFSLTGQSMPTTANNHTWVIYFPDYTNSSFKTIQFWMTANNFIGWGYQNTITSAITAIRFYPSSGASFSGGTYELQGIK